MPYCWLKKRGNVYWIYYSKRLHLKPESLGTRDKALAKEVQRRRESDFFCNTQGIRKARVEHVTYSELVRRFIESRRAAGITSGTLKTYVRTCNAFGFFLNADLFVDTITPEHVEQYIARRRESCRHCDRGKQAGRILKPKSIHNEAAMLRALFRWGVELGFLAESPMRRVAMPKKVVYDAQRALSPDEYLKVRENVAAEYRDVLDLYLLTGLRRGEGLRVTSENFDFVRGVATFYQGKTGRHKTLPISHDLAEVAHRMIEKVGEGNLLIGVQASALTVAFRKARMKAGLPESVTFHSLRHSFASWLAQAGVDFRTLQSLTGHQSSQALEIYLQCFDPTRRSAIERLQLPKVANG